MVALVGDGALLGRSGGGGDGGRRDPADARWATSRVVDLHAQAGPKHPRRVFRFRPSSGVQFCAASTDGSFDACSHTNASLPRARNGSRQVGHQVHDLVRHAARRRSLPATERVGPLPTHRQETRDGFDSRQLHLCRSVPELRGDAPGAITGSRDNPRSRGMGMAWATGAGIWAFSSVTCWRAR
jgi:hypothetical protein